MGLCGSSHPVAATGTPASSSTAAGGTSPPPPPPQPPPDYLLCPLTGELMAEPVLAPSGHTYERVAIKAFLIARSCDPITGMPMTVDELKPNTALQKAIEDFDKTGARYFKRAPAEIQASVAAASGGTATSGTTHAHLPATAAATAAAATAAAATAAAAAAAGATSPAPLARDRPPPSTASPSSAMPRCFQCGAEAVTRTRVGMDSWVPACEACTAAIKQGSGRFGSNSATTKTTASPRTITASSSSATGGQGALGRFLSGGEEELKEAVAMSSSSSSSIASSGGGSTQAAGGGGGGVGPGRRKSALDRFLMGSADVEAKTDAMPASASPYLAASSPPQPSSSFQAASPAFPFGTEGKTDPIPVDRPAASNGSSACSSNNYNLDGSSASNRDGSNCGAGEASSRVRGVDKVDWRHVVDRPAPAPGDDGRWERWWCRKCDCHTFRQSFERSTVCQCGHGEMYHREKDEKPLHLLAAPVHVSDCVECGGPIMKIDGNFTGRFHTVSEGKVHSECWHAFKMKSAPECLHCNRAVMKWDGKFSGQFYPVGERKVHVECWADYKRSQGDVCKLCEEVLLEGHVFVEGVGKFHESCFATYQAAAGS